MLRNSQQLGRASRINQSHANLQSTPIVPTDQLQARDNKADESVQCQEPYSAVQQVPKIKKMHPALPRTRTQLIPKTVRRWILKPSRRPSGLRRGGSGKQSVRCAKLAESVQCPQATTGVLLSCVLSTTKALPVRKPQHRPPVPHFVPPAPRRSLPSSSLPRNRFPKNRFHCEIDYTAEIDRTVICGGNHRDD